MHPNDRKVLKKALASLPASRRASMESILLQDANPASKDQNLPSHYYGLKGGVQASLQDDLGYDADPNSEDQNLPEHYYGLPPKGVQASLKRARYRYPREADAIDDALPQRAQALYTKLVTDGKLRSNLMAELRAAMIATGESLGISPGITRAATEEMLDPSNY